MGNLREGTMNKEEREALKEVQRYEMEVIEQKLLEKAAAENADYSNFEYTELQHILNCIKAKYDLFVKVTFNIELIVGTMFCATVTFFTSLPNLLSYAVNVIIMLILYFVWRYACKCCFEQVTNFFAGKCKLYRNKNYVQIDVDGFKPFIIQMPNK